MKRENGKSDTITIESSREQKITANKVKTEWEKIQKNRHTERSPSRTHKDTYNPVRSGQMGNKIESEGYR
jgi:hypothetical protein